MVIYQHKEDGMQTIFKLKKILKQKLHKLKKEQKVDYTSSPHDDN